MGAGGWAAHPSAAKCGGGRSSGGALLCGRLLPAPPALGRVWVGWGVGEAGGFGGSRWWAVMLLPLSLLLLLSLPLPSCVLQLLLVWLPPLSLGLELAVQLSVLGSQGAGVGVLVEVLLLQRQWLLLLLLGLRLLLNLLLPSCLLQLLLV